MEGYLHGTIIFQMQSELIVLGGGTAIPIHSMDIKQSSVLSYSVYLEGINDVVIQA
jgi:hypothetical protein